MTDFCLRTSVFTWHCPQPERSLQQKCSHLFPAALFNNKNVLWTTLYWQITVHIVEKRAGRIPHALCCAEQADATVSGNETGHYPTLPPLRHLNHCDQIMLLAIAAQENPTPSIQRGRTGEQSHFTSHSWITWPLWQDLNCNACTFEISHASRVLAEKDTSHCLDMQLIACCG